MLSTQWNMLILNILNIGWQHLWSFSLVYITHMSTYHLALFSYYYILIIPPATKLRGGILDSPCSSVRLSVCLSVCPSVRPWVGVRMITLILFSGFKIFFYIYHLGEDLAWDWISASYLIKYAHTGRSCDLLIFGIPEVNFLVRAFQFGMKGVLSRIYDISPGFC